MLLKFIIDNPYYFYTTECWFVRSIGFQFLFARPSLRVGNAGVFLGPRFFRDFTVSVYILFRKMLFEFVTYVMCKLLFSKCF